MQEEEPSRSFRQVRYIPCANMEQHHTGQRPEGLVGVFTTSTLLDDEQYTNTPNTEELAAAHPKHATNEILNTLVVDQSSAMFLNNRQQLLSRFSNKSNSLSSLESQTTRSSTSLSSLTKSPGHSKYAISTPATLLSNNPHLYASNHPNSVLDHNATNHGANSLGGSRTIDSSASQHGHTTAGEHRSTLTGSRGNMMPLGSSVAGDDNSSPATIQSKTSGTISNTSNIGDNDAIDQNAVQKGAGNTNSTGASFTISNANKSDDSMDNIGPQAPFSMPNLYAQQLQQLQLQYGGLTPFLNPAMSANMYANPVVLTSLYLSQLIQQQQHLNFPEQIAQVQQSPISTTTSNNNEEYSGTEDNTAQTNDLGEERDELSLIHI